MKTDATSPFRQVYENRHKLAQDWKKEGKKLFGYLYSCVPEELIYAAGILPVQLTESEESDTAELGRTRLPNFYCDLVLSIIGQALDGTYDYLDGVVLPDGCNTMRRMAGSWKLNIKTPYFFYLTPPLEATPGAKTYYREVLIRLKRSLEEYSGKKITEASLRSAIEVYNRNRELMRKLYELRLQNKPPFSGSQVLDVVKASLVMPKEEHNKMLEKLLQQAGDESRESKARFRLLVSLFAFEDVASPELNIVQMLEDMGAEVVFDDLCLGPRYFWEPVKLGPDLLDSLVERYAGKVPIPFRYPLEPRLGKLLEEAHRYRVDGAVLLIPKFCDPYLYEFPYLEEGFKQQKTPTLMLESTESMAAQQVRVRLQAFTEMLG